MMDVIQTLWVIVQLLAAIVMWVSLALFLLKALWNLGVPYAMIHEALVRPQDRHGWSLFILLDLGLLVLALIGSALAGEYAVGNPLTIALYGIGVIVASYVHLITVLLVGGWWFWRFSKDRQGNNHPS